MPLWARDLADERKCRLMGPACLSGTRRAT
jgi:hypothetical protein